MNVPRRSPWSRDESGVLPVARSLRVLVVGGLDRLDAQYRDASPGVDVEFISVDGPLLERRAEAADALVLLVNNVSHAAAGKVRRVAKRRGTPLVAVTGAGVSKVRASIETAARRAG